MGKVDPEAKDGGIGLQCYALRHTPFEQTVRLHENYLACEVKDGSRLVFGKKSKWHFVCRHAYNRYRTEQGYIQISKHLHVPACVQRVSEGRSFFFALACVLALYFTDYSRVLTLSRVARMNC